MTFRDSLRIVCVDMLIKLVVPGWAMGFTERLRNIRLAFREFEVRFPGVHMKYCSELVILQVYVQELIETRRSSEKKEELHDLCSNLLEANESDIADGAELTDVELISSSCFS
jgi:hypothetical protein